MDDEDTGTLTELEDETLPEPAPYLPAPPMSPWFWVAFGLIGILIILIIYGQVQGITHAVTVNLTGNKLDACVFCLATRGNATDSDNGESLFWR